MRISKVAATIAQRSAAWMAQHVRISPDGLVYMKAAAGHLVPSPYSRRWLLPKLLGNNPGRWVWLTWISLALTPLAAAVYFAAAELSGARFWYATALLCILPGVWRSSWRFPVLIDAPSFLLTLLTAAVAIRWPIATPLLALPLGALRESGPVFAALWAWSPWPLVGLAAAGWWRKSAPPDQPWLAHPIREAWKLRRTMGWDASVYLWPLGPALLGTLEARLQVWLTLVITAAQLALAQDTIRLTAAALPVLVVAAAHVTPSALMPLGLLIALFLRDEKGRL